MRRAELRTLLREMSGDYTWNMRNGSFWRVAWFVRDDTMKTLVTGPEQVQYAPANVLRFIAAVATAAERWNEGGEWVRPEIPVEWNEVK